MCFCKWDGIAAPVVTFFTGLSKNVFISTVIFSVSPYVTSNTIPFVVTIALLTIAIGVAFATVTRVALYNNTLLCNPFLSSISKLALTLIS